MSIEVKGLNIVEIKGLKSLRDEFMKKFEEDGEETVMQLIRAVAKGELSLMEDVRYLVMLLGPQMLITLQSVVNHIFYKEKTLSEDEKTAALGILDICIH